MKKSIILIIAFLSIFSMAAMAKEKNKKMTVDFYGVDFSEVNVIGASESDTKFIEAFQGINGLFVSEPKKYDIAGKMNLIVNKVCTDYAVQQLKKLESYSFQNKELQDVDLPTIIKAYPDTDANVLIIVARKLNKPENTGYYTAVIFNGQTKEIIEQKEFKGKAGGFGLRNFWAGSLYKGMGNARFNNSNSSNETSHIGDDIYEM